MVHYGDCTSEGGDCRIIEMSDYTSSTASVQPASLMCADNKVSLRTYVCCTFCLSSWKLPILLRPVIEKAADDLLPTTSLPRREGSL